MSTEGDADFAYSGEKEEGKIKNIRESAESQVNARSVHSEAAALDAKSQIFASPQAPQRPPRRASIDSIRSQESNVSQVISHASKVCV